MGEIEIANGRISDLRLLILEKKELLEETSDQEERESILEDIAEAEDWLEEIEYSLNESFII